MWEKPTLLAVDDEPLNLELLKAILEPKDYTVITANNGAEALDILANQKIDLLLLDVMMPLINGFEVTRRIRASEKTRGLPVILITALSEPRERIMGLEAGCDEFVSKPFDRLEVLARIKTVLKLNYYRSQIDEKEKFEHVINQMNDGLIVCDATGNIVRTNQKGREMLGSEDLSPGWVRRLNKTYKTGYTGDLERDLPVQDLDFDLERPGTALAGPLIISFSSSVIKDTQGGTVSVVIVLHDVTELRKEGFQKENFLGLLSSRLRSPLAAGLEHLDLIQKTPLSEGNGALKQSVDGAIKKFSEYLRMTEKIFDYLSANATARFEVDRTGKEDLSMRRVEAMVRSAAESRPGHKVECAFDLSDDLSVPISEELFGVVVQNLVENSLKFSGQPVTRLSVSAAPEGTMVRFSFCDNGPGIPSEKRRDIFEAFHPLGKPRAVPAQDLGLGLAIVKRIIEGKLGDIRAEESADRGACISFTLPRSTAPPSAAL